jgi:hypothetical protein
MYYIYGDSMPVKTTILLKDEIYEQPVKRYGRRKISKTTNDVLTNQFSTPKKHVRGGPLADGDGSQRREGTP